MAQVEKPRSPGQNKICDDGRRFSIKLFLLRADEPSVCIALIVEGVEV